MPRKLGQYHGKGTAATPALLLLALPGVKPGPLTDTVRGAVLSQLSKQGSQGEGMCPQPPSQGVVALGTPLGTAGEKPEKMLHLLGLPCLWADPAFLPRP